MPYLLTYWAFFLGSNEVKLSKSSAIPSWSGFVYQGKVALYHALSLLNCQDTRACSLKVESLDDFVIYDRSDIALSLHQVKAINSARRSSYLDALKQVSAVNHDNLYNGYTRRFFHVAQPLDDYSDFLPVDQQVRHKVVFYSYCNKQQYVYVDEIDDLVEHQINQYLRAKQLDTSSTSVSLKREKLEGLLAAKVNVAHRKNQSGLTKFKAADSTPIFFSEIEKILNSELIDVDDESTILFRFRHHLLDKLSCVLMDYEEENSIDSVCFVELAGCYNAIAKMDSLTLKKLYFSKSPHSSKLELEGFGDAAAYRYADIIAELTGLHIKENILPHYYLNGEKGRYLPSVIELGGRSEKTNLNSLQKNIEGIKANPIVRHVLYEYENLIIKGMERQAFRLKDKTGINNKFTDMEEVQETEKSKITKMKNIRFISLKEAKNELRD